VRTRSIIAQDKKPIVKAVFFIAILSSDGVGLNRSLEDFGAMLKGEPADTYGEVTQAREETSPKTTHV